MSLHALVAVLLTLIVLSLHGVFWLCVCVRWLRVGVCGLCEHETWLGVMLSMYSFVLRFRNLVSRDCMCSQVDLLA